MAKIVRLDNVAATKVPSLLKSAKYMVSDVATEVENGVLVAVGKLVDGEREIHKATEATSGDENVGIVCTPELIYDERGVGDADLANFKNEADAPIRVAILQRGDIFSVANEGVGSDKEVGLLTAVFMGTETVGRYTYNVYEVM